MIDTPNSFVVNRIPHVFSRVDNATREKYIERYKTIKTSGIAVSFGVVTVSGLIALSKDIAVSKLKAFGYKRLLALIIGPFIQVLGLPMYIFSYGLLFRKYARLVIAIGATITRGEFEIVNLFWIVTDLALFGESIPITDDSSFKLIKNKSESVLLDLILFKMNEII